MIHFYETFLGAYDPKLKKARGVWYTPEPVVNFIVRAVDDILKTEFGLKDGLADTSKTKVKVDTQIPNKNYKTGYKQVEQEVHKVQILDPATGTGTFLAEVVKHIYKNFKGQQGIWSNYVENHLLPRLNGFELLMASYAMAHLKLELLLAETGYKPTREQRLKVYLTNSLEEHHPDTGTLFANWLSTEASEANHIKRDTPVMCVIGNPPYSGESSNKGEWIMKLMEDYKKEPGGKEKLKERNPKWINDDYVKFLRYGQYFIEKNDVGILAYINPHGFLDNPTFRGMRWNLLKTFDIIYTIDLHGNSKKKETAPDGSADINVFDIMQGVSINLFVKTGKKKDNELGKVFHFDLLGKREMKYDFLYNESIKTVTYKELTTITPNYFFTNKVFEEQNKFNKGFSLSKIFTVNSAGIVTARDKFTIHFSKAESKKKIEEFIDLDDETARRRFNLGKDVRDWSVSGARNDLKSSGLDFSNIVRIVYRPFEERYTYFTGTTKGFHCMPRNEVMKHIFKKDNLSLICPKQVPDKENSGIFISKFISGHKTCSAYNINNIFPLYFYPETNSQQTIEQTKGRIPNLNQEIVNQIAEKLGLEFIPEKEAEGNVCFANSSELRDDYKSTFAPIDLLDYISAVLHSPTYREKYKEFLKIDFPRVPYPKDQNTFWQLVQFGGELRRIHLLESETVENSITTYPQDGDNTISRKMSKNSPGFELSNQESQLGKVWINDRQYFDQVPLTAWKFYIGGYQPAQKWLKDRRNRQLSFDDIRHYQKIIVALTETDRLMKEIDKIEIEG
ncbi:MAG: N-6 DNA methylase, partial [Bacteroidales bacterium]|nr:N-6 DNA methylase [Bacteroidales bacterium]